MRAFALIQTGGTISSAYSDKGDVISAGKVTSFPLLGTPAETVSPFCILSENLTAERLERLGDCVEDCLTRHPCAVITHGTDTLAFTAAYLALRLAGRRDKAVFLVSSDFPLSEKEANGWDNLRLTAAALRQSDLCGVFVPYRNIGEAPRLHFAARVLPLRAFDGALFSADNRICGQLCGDRLILTEKSRGGTLPPGPLRRLTAPVTFVTATPFTDWTALAHRLRAEGGTAVIEGYHSGTVRTDGADGMAALRGLPVYLAGGRRGPKYESLQTLPDGVRAVDNVSPLVLSVKVRLAVANLPPSQRLDYIVSPSADEFF